MTFVDLTAGPIEIEDSGGEGPVVVLLGGLAIDGSLWDGVVARLRENHRCIVATMPWGGHKRPMKPDADLTLEGHARTLGELLDTLDLHDVTLVECDSAMAQLLAADGHPRLGRVVICSCEAFDNYPPGLPGKMIGLMGRLPGGVNMAVQPMRLSAMRRTPLTFGWMAKRPIPKELSDRWLAPLLGSRAIRRDLARYIRSVRATVRDGVLPRAAERLRGFDRPALVVWAKEDRVMPIEHGRRLAELLPQGRLVEVEDSYTLIPLDQPQRLADEIAAFVAEPVTATS